MIQMVIASHRQVDTAVFVICRNLKLLDLRYTLELDLRNLPEGPVTPMAFGVIDKLKELQINLTIHAVSKVGPIDLLVEEWLQGSHREQLERVEAARAGARAEEVGARAEEVGAGATTSGAGTATARAGGAAVARTGRAARAAEARAAGSGATGAGVGPGGA